MAYMNQDKKAKIVAALKLVVPKGWKFSLRCDSSGITMTIASAPVDLIAEINRVEAAAWPPRRDGNSVSNYVQVNPYHYGKSFDKSLPAIAKIIEALNTGNHDNSDIMTDYFDVGHYVHLHIGRWDKAFEVKSLSRKH